MRTEQIIGIILLIIFIFFVGPFFYVLSKEVLKFTIQAWKDLFKGHLK